MSESLIRKYLSSLRRELSTGHTKEHSFMPALEAFVESIRNGIDVVDEAGEWLAERQT